MTVLAVLAGAWIIFWLVTAAILAVRGDDE
jgi:hypothetical protein